MALVLSGNVNGTLSFKGTLANTINFNYTNAREFAGKFAGYVASQFACQVNREEQGAFTYNIHCKVYVNMEITPSLAHARVYRVRRQSASKRIREDRALRLLVPSNRFLYDLNGPTFRVLDLCQTKGGLRSVLLVERANGVFFDNVLNVKVGHFVTRAFVTNVGATVLDRQGTAGGYRFIRRVRLLIGPFRFVVNRSTIFGSAMYTLWYTKRDGRVVIDSVLHLFFYLDGSLRSMRMRRAREGKVGRVNGRHRRLGVTFPGNDRGLDIRKRGTFTLFYVFQGPSGANRLSHLMRVGSVPTELIRFGLVRRVFRTFSIVDMFFPIPGGLRIIVITQFQLTWSTQGVGRDVSPFSLVQFYIISGVPSFSHYALLKANSRRLQSFLYLRSGMHGKVHSQCGPRRILGPTSGYNNEQEHCYLVRDNYRIIDQCTQCHGGCVAVGRRGASVARSGPLHVLGGLFSLTQRRRYGCHASCPRHANW